MLAFYGSTWVDDSDHALWRIHTEAVHDLNAYPLPATPRRPAIACRTRGPIDGRHRDRSGPSVRLGAGLQFVRPHHPVPLDTGSAAESRYRLSARRLRRFDEGGWAQPLPPHAPQRRQRYLPSLMAGRGTGEAVPAATRKRSGQGAVGSFGEARGGIETIPEHRPSYFIQRTDATLAMFRHDRDNRVIGISLLSSKSGL